MADSHSPEKSEDIKTPPLEYDLRKYLLLLAIMVATVTYAAGFNPPGGGWQGSNGGHLEGDSIFRDTQYPRYLVFFYCNAAAFALSVVVIILIFVLAFLYEKANLWVSVLPLRAAMVLDLMGLIGAYAAGTSREVLKARNVWVLIAIFAYMVVQVVLTSLPEKPKQSRSTGDDKEKKGKEQQQPADHEEEANNPQSQPGGDHKMEANGWQSQPGGDKEEKKKRHRKLLILLATFVLSITYTAGLSAPGGYWGSSSQEGHSAGDPVLREHHSARLKAFFAFNGTAFVMSLLIIILLLNKKKLVIVLPQDKYQSTAVAVRTRVLKAYIITALVGLVGAYAAGSTRESDTTVYVSSLVGAVLGCILLLTMVIFHLLQESPSDSNGRSGNEAPETPNGGQINGIKVDILEKAQSLVVLLSTLVATVTYQAGLVPPGGVWQDNRNGHEAGDPILLSMQPRRYKVFFYSNSIAFAASLVIIILVRYRPILQRHILEVAMVLDLFGLIGAYSAGSCRDITTSIYVIALAGVVLVYVVIHVTFFTLEDGDKEKEVRGKNNKGQDKNKKDGENMNCSINKSGVDKRRKRLLLFAVLGATLTYQAGLTPPGGFRLEDDALGQHVGDPVLLHNYPRRYKIFFYCNSGSFMSSIALIILLVNRNLYRPAIRSYALMVCTAVGLFVLMCAYAAGSTQHLKTSFYIFGLVISMLFIMILVLICSCWSKGGLFSIIHKSFYWRDVIGIMSPSKQDVEIGSNIIKSPETQDEDEAKEDTKKMNSPEIKSKVELKEDDNIVKSHEIKEEGEVKQKTVKNSPKKNNNSKEHAKRKYLMLLGVLAASVTYQAGLNPPGGVWQDNSNGHAAGNPVMHDNRRYRYLTFFYSNSISFVASIVVIILLLLDKLIRKKNWWFWVMNIMIVLNLLSLLLAYMAGSRMRWESSGYIVMFVLAALGFAAIHKIWSFIRGSKKTDKEMVSSLPVRPTRQNQA